MVKKTAIRMRVTSAPMSPICLAKPMANSFSGWVLVSSGEFMNSVSMRGRDLLGLPGVGDALDVPAGLAAAELARLVEVGDVDQHHVGVAAHRRVLGVHHAHQVELPVQAHRRLLGVDLRADRQLLPDLPAVPLDQPRAGHGPGARLDERLALGRRDGELRVHVQIALRVDREHRETRCSRSGTSRRTSRRRPRPPRPAPARSGSGTRSATAR